jgi:methylase of polypeptide subunit release factors
VDLDPSPVPPVRACRFGPLVVEYDDRVLTPRPWTAEQSRWAAELAADAAPGPLLELCAGAGHIGLAAAVLADRELVQVESDPVAAGYAARNAARAGRSGRVQVRTARLQDALRPGERFPLVIADPPYLPSEQVARWPDDPVAAIDGGADGLDVVRACLAVAGDHLPAGGPLLLQVAGPRQAAEVARSAARFRHESLRIIDDERAIALLRRI